MLPSTVPLCGAVQPFLPPRSPPPPAQVLSIAIGFFLAIWLAGAAVFSVTEGWSYGEAVWYGFVTLSTIGFGDYTPETTEGQLFAYAYILCGFGVGAFVISAAAGLWEAAEPQVNAMVGRLLKRVMGPKKRQLTARLPSFIQEAVEEVYGLKDKTE